MKKIIQGVFIVPLLFFVFSLKAEEIIKDSGDNLDVGYQEQEKSQHEFNRLSWLEVTQSIGAIQLIFDFTQPIYFKKTLSLDNLQLNLSFPGMRLQHFDKEQVIAKLNKLKQLGLVKKIDLFEQNEKFPQVILVIDFEKTRKINQAGKQPKTIKNSLVIKCCKLEDPNRLVFDIFTEEALKKINARDAVVLQASNAQTRPEKFRIVLDAGHGGKEFGAQSYGLNEKDLALDIALRTRSFLQKNGLTVLLTRNSDVDISWSERKELANQLKAHLFVSIHLNSGGLAGAGPSGVETFYLDSKNLFPPVYSSDFLFVNLEKKKEYEDLIDKQLKDKMNLSRKLARTIQENVVSLLRTQEASIVNRGVKPGLFHIFFNNQRPTALVEVGFITNKKEAQLLTKSDYRDFIAKGICKGITDYISLNKNHLN